MVAPRAPITTTIAGCLLLQACGAGWHRAPDLAPGPLSPRQQVQVWHDGRVERWHGLLLSPDSVSGIPYLHSVDCDTCRVVLPRTQVDSIRLGNPVAGFWKTVGHVKHEPDSR